MDQPSLYDDDIVTWSEQQAAAVRALARRPDLSNALDWENVAEEIESVGRSHVRAVRGLLIQLLAHLIKRVSAPTASANPHWRREVVTFQVTALDHFERSMRQRLDVNRIWRTAVVVAEADLLPFGNELIPGLPADCPVSLDDLLSETFDADDVLHRLATATSRSQSCNLPPTGASQ